MEIAVEEGSIIDRNFYMTSTTKYKINLIVSYTLSTSQGRL